MLTVDRVADRWCLYPRTYVAPRATNPIQTIDGDLTKPEWQNAPWSEPFDDIRGEKDAPTADRPRPTCETRMKMMWDEEYLYIGAILNSDMPVSATFTERNSPIYQRDSDFEVFIDPLGSCHDYKEFEVNAINTVWNLMLDRPYNDNGCEHSGRIAKPGDPLYYDVSKQRSATRILDGHLNDPYSTATWSMEIAMAYSDILAHIPDASPPKIGTKWRINFSRVEEKGDINWTWQPQIVWNAAEQCYSGYVQMHLPDAWGYLVFGDDDGGAVVRDETWPSRLAAMNVYYAQHEYKNATGHFANKVVDLAGYLDTDAVEPFEIVIDPRRAGASKEGWIATVRTKNAGPSSTVSVTDDRLLQVHAPDTPGGVVSSTSSL